MAGRIGSSLFPEVKSSSREGRTGTRSSVSQEALLTGAAIISVEQAELRVMLVSKRAALTARSAAKQTIATAPKGTEPLRLRQPPPGPVEGFSVELCCTLMVPPSTLSAEPTCSA